jgi:hypothetical protein
MTAPFESLVVWIGRRVQRPRRRHQEAVRGPEGAAGGGDETLSGVGSSRGAPRVFRFTPADFAAGVFAGPFAGVFAGPFAGIFAGPFGDVPGDLLGDFFGDFREDFVAVLPPRPSAACFLACFRVFFLVFFAAFSSAFASRTRPRAASTARSASVSCFVVPGAVRFIRTSVSVRRVRAHFLREESLPDVPEDSRSSCALLRAIRPS